MADLIELFTTIANPATGKTLSLSTAKTYASRFAKSNGGDMETILAYIADKKNKSQYVQAIRWSMEVLGLDTADVDKLYESLADERKPTYRTESKVPYKPWTEYIKLADMLEENLDTLDYNDFQAWIVARLITSTYPVRNGEITSTYVYSGIGEKPANFIDLHMNLWVIGKHKTDAVYGTKVFKLPPLFVDNLLRIRRKFRVKSKSLLTNVRKTTPMNEDEFSRWVHTTGLEYGSQTWRTSYVSYVRDNKLMTAKELEILARQMGHSVAQQATTYSKHSEALLGHAPEKPDVAITNRDRSEYNVEYRKKLPPGYWAERKRIQRKRAAAPAPAPAPVIPRVARIQMGKSTAKYQPQYNVASVNIESSSVPKIRRRPRVTMTPEEKADRRKAYLAEYRKKLPPGYNTQKQRERRRRLKEGLPRPIDGV